MPRLFFFADILFKFFVIAALMALLIVAKSHTVAGEMPKAEQKDPLAIYTVPGPYPGSPERHYRYLLEGVAPQLVTPNCTLSNVCQEGN